MPSGLARLGPLLQRWLGRERAPLAVWRGDDVSALKLPRDMPASVRPNTDHWVGMDGETLLVDLRGYGWGMFRDRLSVSVGSRELSPLGAASRQVTEIAGPSRAETGTGGRTAIFR